MSEENIILNLDFFNKQLVRIPERNLSASLYKGSNQKKILIVSIEQEENQLVDDAFLKKIFLSVNIDVAQDCTLLAFPQNSEFSWKTITKNIEFDSLVFFGNEPKKLGLQLAFQAYVPFTFQHVQFLIAEPLSAIAQDRAKKGALWNALKSVFINKQ